MTPFFLCFVEAIVDGKTIYRVAVTTNGIDRRVLPPRFNHPRKAARYADLMEQKERGQ